MWAAHTCTTSGQLAGWRLRWPSAAARARASAMSCYGTSRLRARIPTTLLPAFAAALPGALAPPAAGCDCPAGSGLASAGVMLPMAIAAESPSVASPASAPPPAAVSDPMAALAVLVEAASVMSACDSGRGSRPRALSARSSVRGGGRTCSASTATTTRDRRAMAAPSRALHDTDRCTLKRLQAREATRMSSPVQYSSGLNPGLQACCVIGRCLPYPRTHAWQCCSSPRMCPCFDRAMPAMRAARPCRT